MIGRTIISPARRALSHRGIVAFLAFMLAAVLVTPAFAAPVITKTPGGPLAVTEGGAEVSYTISIQDAPDTGNLVIRLNPANVDQCRLSITSGGPYTDPLDITFTQGVPNQSITVYGIAVDDFIAESPHPVCNITGTKVGTAPANYTAGNVLTNSGININVTDNDIAGITVLDSPMVLAEGGATDTFRVQLSSQPTANVTVSLSTSDSQTSFLPTSLSFTSGNWNSPQTVTVTAIDDGVVEGNHTGVVNLTSSSTDLNYSGKTGSASADITDNDTATITFFDTDPRNENEPVGTVLTTFARITYSAGASSLAASLSLTVTPTGTSANPATFNVDYSQTTVGVTFAPTAADNSTQPIDFSVIDDLITEPTEQFTFSFTSPSSSVSNMLTQITSSDTQVVNIIDDDLANITINIVGGVQPFPLDEDQSLIGEYSMTLATIPDAPVIINFEDSAGQCLFIVDGDGPSSGPTASVALTDNVTTVTVFVLANDDLIVEADPHPCTITHTLTTSASGYSSLMINPITGSIIENDFPPGIIVTNAPVAVDETGPTSDTFLVRLASAPTANVTITISTPDGQTGALSTIGGLSTLTFTPGNWMTNQSVTVTAVDDSIFEGTPHSGTIVLDPSSGGDSNYNALPNENVAADITDNETAGSVTVTGSPLTLSEATATGVSYTLAMNAPGGVTATTNITTDADCRISTTSSTGPWFTSLSGVTLTGSTATTVFVRAYNDKIVEGAHTCTITHSNTVSGTSAFNGLSIANVTGNVTDNESATYAFALAGSTIGEATPSTNPTIIVTMSLDGEDTGEAGTFESAFTIPFSITGGSASGGQDCTPCGTVNAQVSTAGIITTQASLTGLFNDRVLEGDETFNVAISAETGGTAGQQAAITLGAQSTHTVTVTDNEFGRYTLIRADGTIVTSTTASEAVTSAAIGMVFQVSYTGTGTIGIALPFDVGYTQTGGSATGGGVDYSFTNGSINFAPGDTFTDQGGGSALLVKPINFTVIDDAIDESPETVIVSAASDETGTSGSYDALINLTVGPFATHTYNITDNDTAGGGGGTGSSGGNGSGGNPYIVREQGATSDSFTYSFTSQPTANVNVTFSVGTQTEVSINGGPFGSSPVYLLTAANWNTPVNVVVRAINDTVYEGGTGTFHAGDITVDFDNASGDPIYAALPNQTLFVDVEDNDLPPTINVSTSSVSVTENGATATFTVTLSANPGSPVTVNITNFASSDVSLSHSSVILDSTNWNTGVTVTATAIDDFLLEPPTESSFVYFGPIRLSASGYSDVDVSASVIDNESATISFSPNTLTLSESAGSQSFDILLTINGTGTGTATVATNYGAIAGGYNFTNGSAVFSLDYGASGGSYSFGPGTITGATSPHSVTIINDSVVESTENFSFNFTGGVGATQVGNLAITITDDDTAGGGSGTGSGGGNGTLATPYLVAEQGPTSNTFTYTLTSQPTADVDVAFSIGGGQTEISVNGGPFQPIDLFTFNASNWNTGVVIIVRAIDDAVYEGGTGPAGIHDGDITVDFDNTSSDLLYAALPNQTIYVNVQDNEQPSINVSQSGGSTNVTENGTTDSFNVTLSAAPAADVTVTISHGADTSSDGGATTGSTTLTFTTVNWNIPQTVTITAFDDRLLEGTEASSASQTSPITVSASGYTTATVDVTVTDNETAVVEFSANTVTLAEASGTTARDIVLYVNGTGTGPRQLAPGYTVSGVVSAAPSGGNPASIPGDASLSDSIFSFAPGSLHNDIDTVAVTVVNDTIDEVNETFTLSFSTVNGATASGIISQVATITDDDTAGVTFTGVDTVTALSENSTTGDAYTVQITTTPSSGNAVIVIDPDVDCEVSINGSAFGTSGTITTNNPATVFNIVVRAFNDRILEGQHTCSVSYTFSGSTAPEYASITRANDVYTVNDNELAIYALIRADGTVATSTTASESVTSAAIGMLLQLDYDNLGTGPIGIDSAFSIGYTQTGGTASGGVDYSFTNGSISFTPADTFTDTGVGYSNLVKPINFTVVDDTFAEVTETVIVTADADETGTSGSPSYDALITLSGGGFGVHTYNITDNDTPNLTQSATTVNVTESGTTATYTLTLTNADAGVTANTDITAGPDCEISLDGTFFVTNILSLPLSNSATTITVRAVNDQIVEGTHTCTISHSNTSGSSVSVWNGITINNVTTTVTDNDTVTYQYTSNTGSGVESVNASGTIELVFNTNGTGGNDIDAAFNVTYGTLSGTATAGTDYTTTINTVTFVPGGPFSHTISVPVTNDTIDESDETFTIYVDPNETGTSGSYAAAITLGTNQLLVYTILDDDNAGVTFTGVDTVTTLNEGNTTGDSYTFNINSTPASGNAIVIIDPDNDCEISVNGSAYGTSATITTNDPLAVFNIDIRPVNDRIVEGSLHTCTVTYNFSTSTSSQYSGFTRGNDAYNINDNDTATYQFAVSTDSVTEGTGVGTTTVNASVTTTFNTSGGAIPAVGVDALETAIQVPFTVNGASTAIGGGTDYTITASPITIPTSGATQNIVITVTRDSITETNETVVLDLGIETGGSSGQLAAVTQGGITNYTLTINDDDQPGINLTGVGLTSTDNSGGPLGPIDEDLSVTDTYTIALNSTPGALVTIGITSGPDCYFNINGGGFGNSGTINTNSITPFTIVLRAVNDRIVEGAHTCTVNYTIGSADSNYDQGSNPSIVPAPYTYDIVDNDSATYQFVLGSSSIPENSTPGVLSVSTTFTTSGEAGFTTPTFESAFISVPFTITGTATGGGTDYSMVSSVIIPNTGTTQIVSVTIVNDAIDELDETVVVTLGNESIGSPEQQAVVTIGSTFSSHTLTILDDDSTPGINITGVNTGIVFDEGNHTATTDSFDIQLNSTPTGNVQIVLTAAPDCEVSVSAINPTIAPTAFGSSVTMTTNSALTVFTVVARPYNDFIVEGSHSCDLTYKVDSSDNAYDDDVTPAIRPATQTYSVLDNDSATYQFVLSSSSIPENATPAILSVTTTFSGTGVGTPQFETAIDVPYTFGGTATGGGVDYSVSGTVSLNVFGTGNTAVTIVNDDLDEANETVIATLGTETGGTGAQQAVVTLGSPSTHTLTINDNDTAGVTVNVGTGVTATEGGTGGSYTVVLTSQPTSNVTITYTITDGQTTTVSSITFTPANWNIPQLVNVTAVNDGFAEGTHTGVISWTSSSSDASYSGTFSSTVSVTITDNDPAVVTVGGGSVDVTEGGATDTYTLSVNAPTGVTSTTTVSGGANCLVSNDGITYSATALITLTGSAPSTVYVQAINDTVVEGAHTCTITHTNLSSASTAINGTVISNVTGNVTDNDTAAITYTAGGSAGEGGSGTAVATLVITANGVPNTGSLGADVTVAINNTTGTATAGDYGVSTSSITFTSGSTSGTQNITYTGTDDQTVEGTETFTLSFGAVTTSISTGVTATGSQTATVTDNDTATITYTSGPAVSEGSSNSATATLTITATGTGAIELGYPVSVVITNATGTAGLGDYGVVTGSISFSAGSGTGSTQSVTYTGTPDAFAEGTENFDLGFGTVTSTASAQITASGTQAVNVTDTNTVTLTNSAGTINLSEATATTSGSYTLSINAQPGTSYTTLVTADADTLVSLTLGGTYTSSVTATLTNSTATTIYVRPVDDRSVEGAHTGTITHGPLVLVGGSNVFVGQTFSNTTVNITDNDTAIIFFTSASSSVAEGASSVGLTATLSISPSGTTGTSELGSAVTVALTATDGTAVSADYSLITSSLTFAAGAGNGATQSFTYSGTNDLYAEPSPESFTINFGTITTSISTGVSVIGTHTGNITDTDTTSITVTDASGSTDISEAVSTPDSYTIQLNAQPSDNYMTTIIAAADCEISLVVGGPYSASVMATISGSTATTVYVRAVNDNIIEGNHTCLIDNGTLIGGSPFNGLSIPDVTANVADNDSATISFSALSNTIAEPSTGSVNAVLTYVTNGTGPASLDTTISAVVTNAAGTASASDYGSVTSSVSFTAGALDGAVQAISYSAVNDAFAEDTETFSVNFGTVTGPATASLFTHTVNITDAGDAVSITVLPNDDDISPVGNELIVSETLPTTSDTYVITLNIEPGRTATTTITAGVDCLVSTDDGTFSASVSATLGGSTVIYVRAVDDSYAETTPHPCVITHSNLVSTVGRFNGQTVANITADVVDSDLPSVVVVANDDDIAPAGNEVYVSEVNLTLTDTYTITMNAVPSLTAQTTVTADVNCLVSTSAAGPFTGSVIATLTGSSPTTIYVRAAQDEYDEPNPHACGISHSNLFNTSAPFNNLLVSSITGSVEDNDTFGVNIVQSGGTAVSEAGLTDTYSLNLTSVPFIMVTGSPVNTPQTSQVTILLSTDAQCQISTDGITFAQSLFRGFNTTTPVTVTVRAVDDTVIEGAHTCPINHIVTSPDAAYNGLSVPTISVAVADNDGAGVTITPTTVSVTEGGTSSSYSVVLTAQPAADVTITIGGSGTQANASTTTLTFTSSNYNIPQTVTVTAIDDNVVEGAHSATFTHSLFTTDPNYNALGALSSVAVNIADNDSIGVVVTQTDGNTAVQEGSPSDSYTVVLTSQPTSDVTITIGGFGTDVSLSSTTLVFTAANWNIAQTVTVTAVNDSVDEDEQEIHTLTHTATSSDSNYNGITVVSVPVLVVDNDVAAVIVTPNAVAVTEGGVTNSYTVVLATEPTATVTVTVTDTTQATASTTTLTFTGGVGGNWNVPQTVTVTAVNDTVAENAHVTVFTHAATSADSKYNGITVNPVQVNITDNDTSGVAITQSGGNTAVSETGPTTDTFTVALNSTPTAAVNFTITADAQCLVSTDGITFNSTATFSLNNTTAQTVTVRAVDDSVVESNPHMCFVSTTVASTDINYNGVALTSIGVQVTDNDTAPLPTIDAVNDSGSTTVNSSVSIAVLGNDTYTGGVTITITGAPTSGNAVVSGNNIIYTNTGGVATTDTFTYRITDGNAQFDSATVTVNVTGVTSIVTNGGFESGSPIPTGFTVVNRGSSGTLCTAGVARTGNCALVIYGSRTPVIFKQVLANPAPGQTVSVSAWVKWANIRAGGYVQVRVFFTDGTSQLINVDVPTAPVTQSVYQNLTANGTVTTGKTVLKAELWIGYAATAGTLTVDDVTVSYGVVPPPSLPSVREGVAPAGVLALPTPSAPDGFRGNN